MALPFWIEVRFRVNLGPVARGQRPHGGWRGEDDHLHAGRLGDGIAIPGKAPGAQGVVQYQVGPGVEGWLKGDEGTKRQSVDEYFRVRFLLLGPVFSTGDEPLPMQHYVDFIGFAGVGLPPQSDKLVVAGAAALGTRAMPSSQGGGFIQEEKLGIFAGGHRRACFAILKLKPTNNPVFMLMVVFHVAPIIVQDAAIAHTRAFMRCGQDIAKGIYSVLKGHWSITHFILATPNTGVS